LESKDPNEFLIHRTNLFDKLRNFFLANNNIFTNLRLKY